MTALKISPLCTFDRWHDGRQVYSNISWDDVRKVVQQLRWPNKRPPTIERILILSWSDEPSVELQLSYHHGCWKQAVYKLNADGTCELLHKVMPKRGL